MVMSLELHPKNAERINRQAEEFVARLQPRPETEPKKRFSPDFHVSQTIGESGIGELLPGLSDPMLPIARVVTLRGPNGFVELRDEAYVDLYRFSESIRNSKTLKECVSQGFVNSTLIRWMKARVNEEEVATLATYVIEAASEAIKTLEVRVPIANLVIERDVSFGSMKLMALTQEVLESWIEALSEAVPEDYPERARWLEETERRWKEDLQGRAALCVTLRAESRFAAERALESAEDLAAFFRVLHPANRSPHQALFCRPLGRENKEQHRVFIFGDGKTPAETQGLDTPPMPDFWVLSEERIKHLEDEGKMDAVRQLLANPSRTDFQNHVRDALIMYSRSTMARDPTDKVIYILVALESLLLRNQSENIQQTVGERLAFCMVKSPEGRQKIVSLTKKCYGQRSLFIHHGRRLEDLQLLEEFMMWAWLFFMEMLKRHGMFETKESFLASVDRLKYTSP